MFSHRALLHLINIEQKAWQFPGIICNKHEHILYNYNYIFEIKTKARNLYNLIG